MTRLPVREITGPVLKVVEARQWSDEALVAACRSGESAAFDELVRRYKNRVYNAVYRFVGNHEDALDISQEVFVRAYRGIADFRSDAKVYTWFYRIAVNLARNRLRDGSRRGRDKGTSLDGLIESAPAVASAATANGRTPRDAAEKSELETMLKQCLEELPEHYRTVFVLRTFEELSYEDIAATLECPVGTVRSRLNQARARLRRRLETLALL